GLVRHRSPPRRHPGAPVLLRQPGAVQLVVARGGPEVPEDRILAARQQCEADVLVALPRPDRRAGQVTEVVRVEQKERTEIGGLERGLLPGHSMTAEPV